MMDRPSTTSTPLSLSFPFPVRQKMALMELTYLAQQWQPIEDPPLYGIFMASSEVDQKILGRIAKDTSGENSYLSSFLFRVLGLSIVLSEQLLQARKARQLDPVRDVKARHLIHHILWLAREGLIMVEQYILPMIETYVELKVLSYKLQASFYHIFVLFHNDPPVNNRVARSRSASTSSAGVAPIYNLFPTPLVPRSNKSQSRSSRDPLRSPAARQQSPAAFSTQVADQPANQVPLGHQGSTSANPGLSARIGANQPGAVPTRTPPAPPGLGGHPSAFIDPAGTFGTYNQNFNYTYYSSSSNNNLSNMANSKVAPDPSLATYLLPLTDYTLQATSAFMKATTFADTLLPGSHPIRLSVKVEYVAYVYDCLQDPVTSRRLARAAVRNVYEATEGMDDDSFEDAAHLVWILGKMMKRGLASAAATSGGRFPVNVSERVATSVGSAAARRDESASASGSVASLPQSTSRKGSGVSMRSGRSNNNRESSTRNSGSHYSNSNGNSRGLRQGNGNGSGNGSSKGSATQGQNPTRRGGDAQPMTVGMGGPTLQPTSQPPIQQPLQQPSQQPSTWV